VELFRLLHHAVCGALGALGFAVLFNVRPRALPACAAAGALAVSVRTLVLGFGWTMEAASFIGALGLGFTLQLFSVPKGVSRNALHVIGAIPMIPGGLIANSILGLFALTAAPLASAPEALARAAAYAVRVSFAIVALGTGLAAPSLLLNARKRLSEHSIARGAV
jgi:uncharacterized membrane protein YjjB (DUF3815 family)